MKTVVYITKHKIWAGDHDFEWDGESMDEVFGKIKKDLKVDGIRVVLGHEVSFVTAVKANDTFLTRENILKLSKRWMPFEVESDCFDWKQVVLGYDEVWLQIVAMEKGLLLSLTSAIKKHGLKLDLVTAIGVLLGEQTVGREAPVVIRWSDKENLAVLAVNGLVDLVVSEINEEDLMVYASQKWGLAVNPEEISLKKGDFNLTERVFAEKTKGEDKQILNLPILKGTVDAIKPGEEKGEILQEKAADGGLGGRKWWLVLLVLVIAGLVVLAGYLVYLKRL